MTCWLWCVALLVVKMLSVLLETTAWTHRGLSSTCEHRQKYQTPDAPKFAVQRPTLNDVLIPAEMQKRFRIAVGLMLFLIKFSCPDVFNAVRELANVNDRATQ